MTQLPITLHERLLALLPATLIARLDVVDSSVFADLTAWLQERIYAVSQFIPDLVVRQQLQAPQPGAISGAMRAGSLLFADLSGFTALSEYLATLGKEGSEEITRVINRLFATLTEQVERYGGDLIKFNGDALTVFFDAETLGDHHPAYAVGAAQMMQRQMQAIGLIDTKLGMFNVALRIGVHSGEAFAAQVGERYQELVLVGADVNRVAQAQEIAAPGDIVVSLATQQATPALTYEPKSSYFGRLVEAEPLPPPVNLPGFEFPADTNDLAELEQMLEVYSSLRRFLPAQLSEAQLLAPNNLATGGLRLVTALFVHVTPFSTLIRMLDGDGPSITPLLNLYYSRMQQIAHHYGGSINKMDLAADGDKLLVIFGAPVAHEHDAELALRAGLAMQDALNDINAEIQLRHPNLPLLDQKIGVNQGHVFAGLVGGRKRREYTVMGDPVNLAARLMSHAPYGDILLGPAVRRHAMNFEFEILPPLYVKGKGEPIEPARITRAYDIRRHASRAPLIGRAEELEQICRHAMLALRGSGQSIHLTGEAGIGKTRLIEEALQWLTLHSFDADVDIPSFNPLTVECQFYEQTVPFASLSDLLRQIIRLSPMNSQHEAVETVFRRVERLTPDLARFAPVLADVLNLPLPDTELTASLTPDQRHARALDLAVALVLAAARQAPLVILWDDLHWIDASSREFVERLSHEVNLAPLFLVVAYRPDLQFHAETIEHLTTISVTELSDGEQIQLAQALLNGQLPQLMLEHWHSGDEAFFNPQGNPFFIEELIRALLDQQLLLNTHGTWQLVGSIESLPSTIEGVIVARLDRLNSHYYETVQIASVIGRRFQVGVLRGLIEPDQNLSSHLEYLAAVDLVQPDQVAMELTYLFKHTLTRDVAYDSILYARRRTLHRHVAQQIEALYGEHTEDFLPVLAHHYARAEDWLIAIDYFAAAARQAQARYANLEAVSHLTSALELLAHTQDGDPALILELQERLGYVCLVAGEYVKALQALQKAFAYAQEQALPPTNCARILRHIATIYERQADYEQASAAVQRGLMLLDEIPTLERVRLLLLESGILQRQGQYHETIAWAERGLGLAQTLDLQAEQASAYQLLGGAYKFLGNIEQSLSYCQQSVAIYQHINRPGKLADVYVNMAISLSDGHRYAESISIYLKAYEIKKIINDVYGTAIVLLNLGDVYRKNQEFSKSLDASFQSVHLFSKIGSRYPHAVCLINIGSTYYDMGQFDDALINLRQSEAMLEQLEVKAFHPEIYRMYAQIFDAQGARELANESIITSIQYAQTLDARLEEGLSRLIHGKLLRNAQPAVARTILNQALIILQSCDDSQAVAECQTYLDEL